MGKLLLVHSQIVHAFLPLLVYSLDIRRPRRPRVCNIALDGF